MLGRELFIIFNLFKGQTLGFESMWETSAATPGVPTTSYKLSSPMFGILHSQEGFAG